MVECGTIAGLGRLWVVASSASTELGMWNADEYGVARA